MNPIVQIVANATPGDKKYILFAGAGISKDAGVPTAWDLMINTSRLLYTTDNPKTKIPEDLEKWFINSQYSKLTYAELIEKIYPKYPDQQTFLEKNLTIGDLGDSHRGVADMARKGIIRAIVTTNFDHFIEKALESVGVEYQVISTDEDLKNSEPLIQCKKVRIYKPHGDLGKGALKNTPKDLEKISRPMEKELIRVLSDHGLIVIGYAGNDKGIQTVFEKRDSHYYPFFWVNPNRPESEIKKVLETQDYIYVPCESAGEFFESLFEAIESISRVIPERGKGPNVNDLSKVLEKNPELAGLNFKDFMDSIFLEFDEIRPDFSKFSERDEAIVAQINAGTYISGKFVEAVSLASKRQNFDALKKVYEGFGELLKFCDLPEGFAGTFYESDFDGYRFLIYQMFVSFVAAMLKYENWEIINRLLSEEIFTRRRGENKYVKYSYLSQGNHSLDQARNQRLGLRRVSVAADMYKEQIQNGYLSKFINWNEFLETDYLLFLRSACHGDDDSQWGGYMWYPNACVYLNFIPSYIEKAEKKSNFMILMKLMGFADSELLKTKIQEVSPKFFKFFNITAHIMNPLRGLDVTKLNTRN